jgi:hypothetical protein
LGQSKENQDETQQNQTTKSFSSGISEHTLNSDDLDEHLEFQADSPRQLKSTTKPAVFVEDQHFNTNPN